MTSVLALLTTPERLTQTHDLLAQLAEAKAGHLRHEKEGASEYRRRLLHEPEISGLVNQIILINEPWIRACITRERGRRGMRDSTEELMSKAITGGYADTAEVGGVFAAILGYNTEQCDGKSFPKYLQTTIRREFEFTHRERRQHAEIKMQPLTGETPWEDRGQAPPASAASKELASVVRDAVRFLPAARKPVAEFMVGRMLESGEWPQHEEVGKLLGVTKERGRQVGNDTRERLRAVLKERYSQLAESEELPDGLQGSGRRR